MTWEALQTEFSLSLKQPDRSVPEEIGKTKQSPSLKRFNVYRNNSAVSLREALASGFPVVFRLVGETFFNAMASVYMERSLPTSPLLKDYGHDFPAFIDDFEPAQSIPYLGDVARVEWAWMQAYHSADADPVGIGLLGDVDPELVASVVLKLHPSLHIIRSEWPVMSVWSAHNQENTTDILKSLEFKAECGIVIRPQLDVNVLAVMPIVADFVEATMGGLSISDAFEKTNSQDADDLSGCLQFLFNCGAVTALEITKPGQGEP